MKMHHFKNEIMNNLKNEVRLTGHLGQDPETRNITADTVVTTFSLATSETWTTKQGEKKTETQWHKCELWGKQAEIAAKYLTKGSQILLSGSIRYESYEKEGETKYITKIRGNGFVMLGGKPSEESKSETKDDLQF